MARTYFLICLVFFIGVVSGMASPISLSSFDEGSIILEDNIRIYWGDPTDAHLQDFDDSEWEKVTNTWVALEDVEKSGSNIRWVRFHFQTDESLENIPMSLVHTSFAHHRIWYNGRLIISSSKDDKSSLVQKAKDTNNWNVFVLDNTQDHVIAVRLEHENIESKVRKNIWSGISLSLNRVESTKNSFLQRYKFASGFMGFVIGMALVFSIMHFLFYLFNPKVGYNLWFSLVCLSYGILTWGQFQWAFYENIETMLFIQKIVQAGMVFTFIFLALFLRSAMRLPYPRYFFVLIASVAVIAFLNFGNVVPDYFFLVGFVMMSTEIFWINYQGIRLKRKGALFIAGGIATFILSVALVVILEIAGFNLSRMDGFSLGNAPYFGFIIAMVGMSLYQSRHLAELGLENERKSVELEKARELQLSLLPKNLPDKKEYKISAAMFTASEVGGDYYDFIVNDDKMIWALGDATGHGTEAGIVAAMTKTLFLSLAPKMGVEDCLREMSSGIKNTGVRQKYMCLGILKLKGSKVSWCAAGIPPALIIRNKDRSIKVLESKGMPLGSVPNFPYKTVTETLEKDDVVILLSDGLAEQMNKHRIEFGDDLLHTILRDLACLEPEKIISELKLKVDSWRGDLPQQDDITIVCFKKT